MTTGDGDPEQRRRTGRVRTVARWAGRGLLVLVVLVLVVASIPVPLGDLHDAPADPATTYAQAEEKFTEWAADETALDVFEPCRSGLYGTGERTEVAVVLFHGLTNCPRQFREIAEQLRSEGKNVVVLRAPEHGRATPDGRRIGDVSFAGAFTAEEIRDWSAASVDIAAGLGDRVHVLGLSMGGVAAAWTAQHREVDKAVLVAPAMTLHGMPGIVDWWFPNLFTRLPHFVIHTDPTLDHSYAGESPAGAAEMFRMAREVRREADDRAPLTTTITVVTNEADEQVDNRDIARLVEHWRAHGAQVDTESFPADLDLPHDVVDVGQREGRTDVTYPVLLAAVR
ncbi:alpha/beta fold hydrolase [Phycicoccus sp. CSK15P-2]|uniref:alpha/beta hydrolase n=1 Tax=Phycicoccus sp. CSK15P-2 TaxID=2807627 RepID=UPI001952975B|nr:alpha/beta fold hydrolase [Phycicoccus sp. CSK15P-2]MBM6402747.1 alpha/beta fold hydrolase [Phycicoccus sp. CSK15P-2]